jgi:hypothetical protein
MPDAPKVTITAIDPVAEEDRDWPHDEGSLKCELCGCVVGYHLVVDRETDSDRGAFTLYWEIQTVYPNRVAFATDTVRLCEDDWAWVTEIALPVIAFEAKS